jgi:hypothetical protein
LLAAYAAICHFCEGRSLQILTNHRPLVTTLLCVSTPISLGQQRYLVFIPEFNVQLLYLPVLKNVVADFLSCPSPTPELSGGIAALAVMDPIDFEAITAEQKKLPQNAALAQQYIAHPGSSPSRRHVNWRFPPSCTSPI